MKSLFLSIFVLASIVLYSQNVNKQKPKKETCIGLVKLPCDSVHKKITVHKTYKNSTDSLIAESIKETMVMVKKKGYID